MGRADEGTSDLDMKVDLAIYDYHAAADRGAAPSPAAWVASHPEIAPQLEEYFRDLAVIRVPDIAEGSGLEQATRSFAPARQTEAHSLDRPGSGDQLGGYELIELLGGGGQGEVWKARHLKSNDLVAVKVLHPWAEQDEASIGRFTEEAKTIAALRHPNIIRIKYFDHDRSRWFFSMDLMEGGTVARRFQNETAPPRLAAELMERVARAIHHAHTRNPGVLHLDLKPANILLDAGGEPRVTDFGLAMRLETLSKVAGKNATIDPDQAPSQSEASVTLTGLGAVGTFPFMSPEMASGRWQDISTGSDVYGLGAILYAMLTGKPPCKGKNDAETLRLVIEGKIIAPRELNGAVDRELEAVCLKCLRSDPSRRYGSADALANDLRRWQRGEPTLAGKPSVGKHVLFWLFRHPFLSAAALLAIGVLALMTGSFGEVQSSNRRDAARLAREIDDKLRMISRAVARSARDENLLNSLRRNGESSERLRSELDAFLLKTTKDYNFWFDLTDSNPLFNVYLLDPAGVLLADTIPSGLNFLGENFSRRDYFHRLFQGPLAAEPGAVNISRVYHSIKDGHYKIAIAARVWDGHRCLAVLVANITIGWRLVDLDMRDELAGAALISPVDWTYSEWEHDPPDRYAIVLSRVYAESETSSEPIWRSGKQLPRMSRFEQDSDLPEDVEYLREGAMTNYHRVGKTPLIVVLRHPYPWPLRMVITWWMLPAALGSVAVLLLWNRSRRAARRTGAQASSP
jgi:eukaryotic-like serine/threonine-protein kinase